MQIGSVEFELFNKIVLKDLYLEDQQGDTLFEAKRLSVGFEFLPLFRKQLIFSSAQLFTFQVNMNKETDESPLNIQFLIDAFASKDTLKKRPEIDLNIHTLNIRRGNFSYHVKDAPETSGQFNAKHLDISNISAKIHLNKLSNDSINISVDKLSMKDLSGLELKRMLFTVKGSDKHATIRKFQIWMPNSHLQLENIHAAFPEDKSPDSFILKTQLSFDIADSEIVPRDLKALVPALNNFRNKISVEGQFKGNYNDIKVSGFQLNDEDHLSLHASLNIKNLEMPDSAYVDGRIDHFSVSAEGAERLINNFSSNTTFLPAPVYKMGNIGFSGHVSGQFHNLKALGVFTSENGNLNVDIGIGKDKSNRLFLQGHIQTAEFNLHNLFPENNPYGKVIFIVDLDAHEDSRKKMAGTINANIQQFEFSNHAYENIRFDGDFTPSSFNGKIEANDAEGKLFAEGIFNLNPGGIPEFDFQATVEHIRLDRLNLTKKYIDSEMSFEIDANFVGNTAENLLGNINLRRFSFEVKDDIFSLDSLIISASGTGDNRLITIQSDILKAELLGAYSYKQIIPAVKQTMHQYIPAIIPLPSKKIEDVNNFYLDLTIENTEKLSKIFKLPFTILKRSKLFGHYNHTDAIFKFEASLPGYKFGGMKMEKTSMIFKNTQDSVDLDIKGIRYGKFDVKTDFGIHLTAKDDILQSFLHWKNREEALYEGKLSASARFFTPEKQAPLKVEVDMLPASLTFNDTTWTVFPAKILVDGDRISVDRLNAEYEDQFIHINGVVSRDTIDNLYVDLNKVNLNYIFNALVIPALNFGGTATGKVVLNDLYQSRRLTTNLDVKNFAFNDAIMGDLRLKGFWDNEKQGIALMGRSTVNDTTYLDIDGIILPSKKELSLLFDAKNANATFIRKYTENILPGFSGKINGNVHVYGNFGAINVEGNALIRDGGFGIGFLNTYYTFNDSVTLTKNKISLNNVALYDKFGHKAIANGVVNHQNFRNFNFSAKIQANNLLAFNASERQNPVFSGTAFGSGSVTIRGTEDIVNIDVSMQTNDKTKISLNFMDQSDVQDYDFISFVNKQKPVTTKENEGEEESDIDLIMNQLSISSNKTEIKLNLMLDVTPDAMLELYIDPVSGDKIKAWGKGRMQIEYGNKSEPRIYGNYTADRGIYNFSLQQVIYKDFHINEGSTINFRGDPFAANLNIDAVYSLPANLGELDHSLNASTANSTTTVNCLMNLSGELQHPEVKFDIRLPNSSDELERQVRNIIGTDDMMNRQIIYLLALGRFYTMDAGSGKNSDFANVASSTISTQLTSLLGPLSENLQIGTNIRTSNNEEYTDTEVKVLLSSQLLNNRLIINGNLGYKDTPNEQRTFIGDFDLEYKLNKSGDIRLKAYNHSNDRYYYIKSAQTTQGVGVMFRKDFNKLYELFRIKKKQQAPSLSMEEGSGEEIFIQFK